MQGFGGFGQKGRLIKVPGQFFSDLLPQIDSLAELKVTLYCFWRLQKSEGQLAYLRQREVLADDIFMNGMGARQSAQREAVLDGLERAVARGTLLHAHLQRDGKTEDLYFVNTARGRAAVAGLQQGEWVPGVENVVPFDLSVERPNIFTLYEQNIGPLTPLIADSLRDMEDTYPLDWIEEAIQIAVENNVRKLRYIEAILERWIEEGRGEDQPAGSRRYISGKYSDEIEF